MTKNEEKGRYYMANRRMFSLDVVDTDRFLEMPATTQALYFHLGMRADDDGFVSSPKKITKIVNCSDDDFKLLYAKGYIIPFESGVIVIKHWRQNNYVRCDRYTKSIHVEEMEQLTLENGIYNTGTGLGIPNDIPAVYTDKNRIEEKSTDNIISPEPDKPTPNPSGILLPLNDKTFYDVPLEKIASWAEAYPAVEVKTELKRMIVWLDSNPTKKKTRRGIERFINNWLARTQDSGGTKGKEVNNQSGGNAYNTDQQWEDTKRAIAAAGRGKEPGEDIFA